MQDLQGPDEVPVIVVEDVEEQLGGRRDGLGGAGRVLVPEQGEVGDGLQVVQVRACQHEEVAEHLVGVPVHGKVGQAVEDVERPAAGFTQDIVNGGDEVLEALLRIELVDCGHLAFVEQGGVVGEAEVDELAPRGPGRLAEGPDERLVLLDGLDLPDDVVADQNAVQHLVQAGEPGRRIGDTYPNHASTPTHDAMHALADATTPPFLPRPQRQYITAPEDIVMVFVAGWGRAGRGPVCGRDRRTFGRLGRHIERR
ncbi:MAG: hypothetical protein ACYTGC_12955 [Planctomycetota bacterium]